MSIHPIMQKLAAKLERTDLPAFAPGDTVRVQVKIREGEKERLQAFEGMVIACRKGAQGSFTVRKMSFGQGVERIFPYNSKVVDKVEKVRSYEVRRSKLFYLRGLRGKAARLREVERAAKLRISLPCFPLSHDFGRGFVLRAGYTLVSDGHGSSTPTKRALKKR